MYEHIEGSWVETDGEGHILDDTHPIILARRVQEAEALGDQAYSEITELEEKIAKMTEELRQAEITITELREDLEEANQLGLVAHKLGRQEDLVKNQQLKVKNQQLKDECTMVTEALFRNYENQCDWQGQDPTDRENYYEEDYPEINTLFDERYGYEESSDEDE